MDTEQIIGPHPLPPHPCGNNLAAVDQKTEHDVPHRVLENDPLKQDELIAAMTQWIVNHHVSPENAERDRKRREALERQGLPDPTRRLPLNTSTQKGNWAEILLAEYLAASSNAQLPVYRLRYNPNVDQSMKGDDVLAFDLNSDPVRVLVGEAKFRSTSTKVVVGELIDALEKSHSGNVPASLQFVADRLFDSGLDDLGAKVAECNTLFAQNRLQLDYVGLLVSNKNAHAHIYSTAQSKVQRLAVMSLVLPDPEG
ncbi:Hachiman antiphage defense system protein HamA, partial [Methylomonas rivi]